MSIFRKLIKDLGGTINISLIDLELIPNDEGIKVDYIPEDDSFQLTLVKIVKQKILTPNKRIIAP